MDRIFKIGLLSLEWQCGLLALNIIPISFKSNVLKTKIWTVVTLFYQSDKYMAAPYQK